MSHQAGPPTREMGHKKLGRYMIVGAWLLLLVLLTLLFSIWLQKQSNPNRSLNIVDGPAGEQTVTLRSNRAGHYLAPGEINGVAVTFLLDTGASRVAVPMWVAERAGLVKGLRSQSMTASGVAETWMTQIDRLRLGPFEMEAVPAVIIPAMPGDEVLLGMSFLKYLRLEQTGERLKLSLP